MACMATFNSPSLMLASQAPPLPHFLLPPLACLHSPTLTLVSEAPHSLPKPCFTYPLAQQSLSSAQLLWQLLGCEWSRRVPRLLWLASQPPLHAACSSPCPLCFLSGAIELTPLWLWRRWRPRHLSRRKAVRRQPTEESQGEAGWTDGWPAGDLCHSPARPPATLSTPR